MYVRTFTLSRQPLEKIIALKKFHRREDRCCYHFDDYHFSFNEGKKISISRREYICVCIHIYIHIPFLFRSLYIIFWLKKSLMPLKISHLRKNLSILDTEKKRSRENPEIVIRFHVFLPPSIRQFSPLLFFRFPNSRNSYGVSTYTYIYIKKELKKNICLFRFRYRSKYPIFHSETDERIK